MTPDVRTPTVESTRIDDMTGAEPYIPVAGRPERNGEGVFIPRRHQCPESQPTSTDLSCCVRRFPWCIWSDTSTSGGWCSGRPSVRTSRRRCTSSFTATRSPIRGSAPAWSVRTASHRCGARRSHRRPGRRRRRGDRPGRAAAERHGHHGSSAPRGSRWRPTYVVGVPLGRRCTYRDAVGVSSVDRFSATAGPAGLQPRRASTGAVANKGESS